MKPSTETISCFSHTDKQSRYIKGCQSTLYRRRLGNVTCHSIIWFVTMNQKYCRDSGFVLTEIAKQSGSFSPQISLWTVQNFIQVSTNNKLKLVNVSSVFYSRINNSCKVSGVKCNCKTLLIMENLHCLHSVFRLFSHLLLVLLSKLIHIRNSGFLKFRDPLPIT